jgi:hypothetical protein
MAGGGKPSWGQSQLQGNMKSGFGNPYLRDYTHAAKTFLPNNYENAPKLKFLFHVVFDTNPEALDLGSTNLSVLVKSVKLPSFNIDTQILNQYNRKRINQTKIKYDPIDITFHDDNGNTISSLWYRYYTYYYNDGRNPQVAFNGTRGAAPNFQNAGGGVQAAASDALYNQRTQYIPSTTGYQDWGYSGQGVPNNSPNSKIPFFNNITIFGINRHEFLSYTLINPIITRFGHDTYDYDQGSGVMNCNMTIDYETVVYNQGAIEGGDASSNIIRGFGDPASYDKRPSPISAAGSNTTVVGQGGIIPAAGGYVSDLSSNFGSVPTGNPGLTGNPNVGYNYQKTPSTGPIQDQITAGLALAKQSTENTGIRNALWNTPSYGQTGMLIGGNQNPPLALASPSPIPSSTANDVQTAGWVVPNPTTGALAGLTTPPIIV